MLRLQTDNGRFSIGDVLPVDPDVEEALSEESVYAPLEWIVPREIEHVLQGEEDGKEPLAVGIRKVFTHDEHIADVRAARAHVGIEGRQAPRGMCRHDRPQRREISRVMGMCILLRVRLDEVVAALRQEDRRLSQIRLGIAVRQDLVFFPAKQFAFCKMSPIVHQAEIVACSEVLPRPIKRGQFTVFRVLRADVVPGVIADEVCARPMQRAPCLDGKIHLVRGHPVWFMRSNCNTYFHANKHLFLHCD